MGPHLAAIFGVAGHRLLSNLLCQVKRVVHNQIQGSPLADLTISTIGLRSGNVAGLANEAHSRPDIKTAIARSLSRLEEELGIKPDSSQTPYQRLRGVAEGQGLKIVTVYIGMSLHTLQLQNLLHSRYVQIALAHSAEDTVGRVLAAVPHPVRLVRILAKSFYREMTKAGFGANEIISAASQIISELTASLKRHARRQDRESAKKQN